MGFSSGFKGLILVALYLINSVWAGKASFTVTRKLSCYATICMSLRSVYPHLTSEEGHERFFLVSKYV